MAPINSSHRFKVTNKNLLLLSLSFKKDIRLLMSPITSHSLSLFHQSSHYLVTHAVVSHTLIV